MRRIRLLSLTIVALCASLLTLSASASRRDVSLTLAAYSTPREAYAKIIPAFQKTPGGQGVNFTQSYGASGEQSRAS